MLGLKFVHVSKMGPVVFKSVRETQACLSYTVNTVNADNLQYGFLYMSITMTS